ncbi:family 20 glycosylhydrolase [Arthrobacter tecti]
MFGHSQRSAICLILTSLCLASGITFTPAAAQPTEPPTPAEAASKISLIPRPANVSTLAKDAVTLNANSVIRALPNDPDAVEAAHQLAERLRAVTGFELPVGARIAARDGSTIELSTRADGEEPEGYELTVERRRIKISAGTAEGLFRGATTLWQLLPPEIESDSVVAGTEWSVPAVHIADEPRYSYRGAMLDVARRFYEVADVKRFIDQMAEYKLNVLHLHLTDDQGWRFVVNGRPELTEIGASTQSGWAPGTGGPWFYTKDQFSEIVHYAADRFIEIVPEVDGPGHSTAAKASLPEVNCDGEAVAPYSGFDIGLPPVCLQPEGREEVREYLQDVLTAASQQSSSDIVHIGGDEVPSITTEQMDWYVRTASKVVTDEGKRVMGWSQIGEGTLAPGTLLQWWADGGDQASIGTENETEEVRHLREGLAQGAQVIASPADRAYLDMKYDASVPYGLSWAGLVDLQKAYEWNPISVTSSSDGTVQLVTEDQVAGVEAALWADRAYSGSTSLPTSLEQFIPPAVYTDFMTFPRMPAIAEIGWSPAEGKSFEDFERRIVDHGLRWDAAGIGYYRAPDVPWHPLPVTMDGAPAAEPASSPDASTPVLLTVPLANNTSTPKTVQVAVRNLGFWRAESPSSEVILPPNSSEEVTLELFPDGGTGWSTVTVDVSHEDQQIASSAVDIVSGGQHVSDWNWSSESNGWGPVERDASNGENAADDGRRMSIQDREYSKGVGVHANSSITLDLNGRCQRFQSDVGIDDEVSSDSVRFRVLRDGVEAYASPVITGSMPAAWVNLDVSSVDWLTLVVDDAGNGNAQDHANWAGAWLRCDSP